jgi:hypothetical protein
MVSLEGKDAATLVDSAGTDAHWLADAAVGRVFVGWSDASRVVLPAAIVLGSRQAACRAHPPY